MIIQQKSRGFICLNAHPLGCKKNVQNQIDFVKSHKAIEHGPRNVLVIGSSTGYGLASRIALAFGAHARTIGVFFEREANNGKTASAGHYNSEAFLEEAKKIGLQADNINGDAFSDEVKEQVISLIKEKYGTIDCIIYSLASPRRTDPRTGETYKSVLKPIGAPFTGKTVNVDTEEICSVTIEPATGDEIEATEKVMGGEDWELWIHALKNENVLAKNVKTIAYTYIGPEITWPIYTDGTIGAAKDDLMRACAAINDYLSDLQGEAIVSVNQAVVTQASAAIPVVPLYISLLLKIMKARGTHEGCIEQMYRLFHDHVFSAESPYKRDDEGRIRLDNLELNDAVQSEISAIWEKITTENLHQLTDFDGYKRSFSQLFGFSVEGVDYQQDVEI